MQGASRSQQQPHTPLASLDTLSDVQERPGAPPGSAEQRRCVQRHADPPPTLPACVGLGTAMWGGAGLDGWGELVSAPVHPQQLAPINALAFDSHEEALWVGTEGGLVAQLCCPTLERYCSVPAHQDRVLGLRSLGEAAVSLSSCEVAVRSSGGAPRLAYRDEVRPAG